MWQIYLCFRVSRAQHLLGYPRSAVLDGLLVVGPGQDDDGVELGVVQLVHGVGRHVEEGVPAPVHDVADGREPHYARLDALARVVLL